MRTRSLLLFCAPLLAAWLVSAQAPKAPAKPQLSREERLERYRNLGKAFYENPTTQAQAVEEFRKAVQLSPDSVREQLNFALALLRAGKGPEAIPRLEAVEKKDPQLPHPFFVLGVELKKQGENQKALEQFQRFVQLVPNEPMGHYNLAVIQKALGAQKPAIAAFEKAAELDPNLAAARFQLFNAYRIAGRQADAQKMLAEFQKLKKEQEGSATPEDVDWCAYAEIYDIAPPPLPERTANVKFEDIVVAKGAPGVAIANGKVFPAHADSGDFDNDGIIELAVVDVGGVSVMKNGKTVHTFPGKYNDAVWFDYDHDYDLDLFLLGSESKVMRNQGAAGFVDRTVDFPFVSGEAERGRVFRTIPDSRGLDLIVGYKGRGAVRYRDLLAGKFRADDWKTELPERKLVADFDRDGREDYAFRDSEGVVHQMMNRTTPRANWIRVKLTGIKNLKTAPYAEVEVKAGALYEKKVYRGEPLVFDLRNISVVDTVRITWPNGLIQNEPNQPVNREYDYKEAQRLSGSCPMIWTWDGDGFRYITDVLGVAPLGAAAGDGRYFETDHDEYIFIPGEALTAKDGGLEVRITEELSEVAYLDKVQLIAVDHPRDVQIYHNDKWKSPPYPEFRLWGVTQKIRPALLEDPKAFRRTISAVAEMHSLTMQFPADAPAKGALVLSGWTDWPDGSTFLSASQELPDGLTPPMLQARNDRGEWVTIDADMGMPAGKPKSIVVPVEFPSKFRDLRIVTNLSVYWTDVFLSPDTASPEAVLTRVAPGEADLRFRGFSPNQTHPQRLEPEKFFYADPQPVSLWEQTPGMYTLYGSVENLLNTVDDRMVVMGSGDEVRLRFAASAFPELKPGWSRDYLLFVDGWAKDRDANTAYSQNVQPLPFHGMSGYPLKPGESHPDPAYQREYNTRPALRLIRSLSE
jgi:tetratricopeptide (TPR) repeat protein